MLSLSLLLGMLVITSPVTSVVAAPQQQRPTPAAVALVDASADDQPDLGTFLDTRARRHVRYPSCSGQHR